MDNRRSLGEFPSRSRLLGFSSLRRFHRSMDWTSRGRYRTHIRHVYTQVLGALVYQLDWRKAKGAYKRAIREQYETSEELR